MGGSYDLSKTGIVFEGVDPKQELSAAQTKETYLIPIESFEASKCHKPVMIKVAGHVGTSTSVTFSPDGSKFAFLKARTTKDWSDSRTIIIAYSDQPETMTEVSLLSPENRKTAWDRSPSSLSWSSDGSQLFLLVEDIARSKLFRVSVAGAKPNQGQIQVVPTKLTDSGSVQSVQPLSDALNEDHLFYTSSSMIESSIFGTINAKTGKCTVISSMTDNGALLGLHSKQVSEFFCNSKDKKYKVHSWLVTPPDFDAKKKYPVALMVHGGPYGSWQDAWFGSWSALLYAAQGYVVFMPNLYVNTRKSVSTMLTFAIYSTGSSSFGAAFSSAVAGDWGGRPYDDIVQAFEYVETKLPFADTNRAVALGGSYGGYSESEPVVSAKAFSLGA